MKADLNNRMHVLLVDLGRELRGGQIQVFYLARALTRQDDMNPVVACPRGSALALLLEREGIPLLPLPGHGPFNPLVLFSVERARHAFSIIHTHDANAASLGWLCKALHGEKVRLVHTRRVSYPLHDGIRLKKYLRANAIVGVSAEISSVIKQAGVPAEKISTIHSGIDPDRYQPQKPRGDGRIVFLSIGALTPQKGYSVLLQAMSVLREMEDLPPWEVRIVGEGPLFNALLEEAVSLGVESHLALLGRQDARHILPDCNVLVAPSVDGEGSSAAIKEGWVTGLPVICSALPSNTELVRDKIDGLVAPTGNPLALAAAMARCMMEAPLRARLSAQGRARVEQFTDRVMALAYADLYRKLADGTTASPPAGQI